MRGDQAMTATVCPSASENPKGRRPGMPKVCRVCRVCRVFQDLSREEKTGGLLPKPYIPYTVGLDIHVTSFLGSIYGACRVWASACRVCRVAAWVLLRGRMFLLRRGNRRIPGKSFFSLTEGVTRALARGQIRTAQGGLRNGLAAHRVDAALCGGNSRGDGNGKRSKGSPGGIAGTALAVGAHWLAIQGTEPRAWSESSGRARGGERAGRNRPRPGRRERTGGSCTKRAIGT